MAYFPGTREHQDTPAATKSPTAFDLGWIVAFLEGEGHFGWKPNGAVFISVSQVDPEPLLRLLSLAGGRIGVSKRTKTGRPPFHRWQANGARARGVMMTVYSFLSLRRRQQIRRALQG